jgi:hypothetical protein
METLPTEPTNLEAALDLVSREDEPPTLETVEALVRLLREHPAPADDAGEPRALPGDLDSLESQLDGLRVGPAPPDSPDALREAWGAVEGGWASRATLEEYGAILRRVSEPLSREAADLDRLEQNLDLEQSRLETLRLLTELLDELLETRPDEGTEEKPL